MFRRLPILLWLVVGLVVACPGQSVGAASEPVKLPADLNLVPRGGAGMISARVADLWRSEATAFLRGKDTEYGMVTTFLPAYEALLGLKLEDVERVTLYFASLEFEPVVIVRCIRPIDRDRLRKTEAFKFEGAEQKLDGRPYFVKEAEWGGLWFPDDRTFVWGAVKNLEAFREGRKHGETGDLAPALEAATRSHVVFAFQLPGEVQAADLILAKVQLAKSLNLKPLLATRSLLLASKFDADAHFRLVLKFAAAGPAEEAEKTIRGLHKWAVEGLPEFRENLADSLPGSEEFPYRKFCFRAVAYLKTVEEGLKNAELRRHGATLETTLQLKSSKGALESLVMVPFVGPMFLTPYFETTTGDLAQTVASSPNKADSLAQLAAAMLAYHKEHGRLPAAAIYSKDGQPLLSWRVRLLPYLGEEELYKQFKLDEAWDGPHNKALVAKMPWLFSTYQGSKPAGPQPPVPTTAFQVFVGKGAAFEGKEGLPLKDFRDGLDQTILIAEANVPVPWTKPQDLAFAAEGPLPPLGWIETLNAAFADGKVRRIQGCLDSLRQGQQNPPATFDEKVLRGLITRSGGEPRLAPQAIGSCEMLYAMPPGTSPIPGFAIPPGNPGPTTNGRNGPGDYPPSGTTDPRQQPQKRR